MLLCLKFVEISTNVNFSQNVSFFCTLFYSSFSAGLSVTALVHSERFFFSFFVQVLCLVESSHSLFHEKSLIQDLRQEPERKETSDSI